jgi:hypothetical protein
MKKITQLILVTFTLLVTQSCMVLDSIKGSGKIATKTLNYSDFNSIYVSNSFKVNIIQSTTDKVIIRYDDNLEDFLNLSQELDKISFGLKYGYNYQNINISVEIHTSNLSKIIASGSSEILLDKFETENLTFHISGASEVSGNLIIANELSIIASGASEINFIGETRNANFDVSGASELSLENFNFFNNLTVESSGASDLYLVGECQNANLDFSGSSELKAKNLIVSNNLIIESSGASSISITANNNITLDLSGASDCHLYGNGKIISTVTSGSSSIKKHAN